MHPTLLMTIVAIGLSYGYFIFTNLMSVGPFDHIVAFIPALVLVLVHSIWSRSLNASRFIRNNIVFLIIISGLLVGLAWNMHITSGYSAWHVKRPLFALAALVPCSLLISLIAFKSKYHA
jgi:hypothetical protein